MAEQFHYPPEVFTLLVEAIPLLAEVRRMLLPFSRVLGSNLLT